MAIIMLLVFPNATGFQGHYGVEAQPLKQFCLDFSPLSTSSLCDLMQVTQTFWPQFLLP